MRRARLLADGAFAVAATLATLAAWPASQAAAQSVYTRLPLGGAILVQVTDTSINPLPADVVLPALGLGVKLSEEGALLFLNVPDGVYLVQARHAGHATRSQLIRVTDDTVRVDFVLAPQAEGARRTADPGGGIAQARLIYFLGRTPTMPLGSFLAGAEIKRRRARTMSALLGRVRDVRIDRTTPGRVTIRSSEATGPGCDAGMLVFVDGMPLPSRGVVSRGGDERADARGRRLSWRVNRGRQETAARALRWVGPLGHDLVKVAPDPALASAAPASLATDIDRIAMSSVVAVEVYPTLASVPAEFLVPEAECGVVLVWRKN